MVVFIMIKAVAALSVTRVIVMIILSSVKAVVKVIVIVDFGITNVCLCICMG